jgi:hypothetical protein
MNGLYVTTANPHLSLSFEEGLTREKPNPLGA